MSIVPLAVSLSTAFAAQPGLTQNRRTEAAQATAQHAQACVQAQPFYWEVGDAVSTLAGGQVGAKAPGPATEMSVASASKWVYGAYVAERRAGRLTDEDVSFLTFQSGYTRFHICRAVQTVAACQGSLMNGRGGQDPSTEGRFDYNGGHMQKHAVLMGLGNMGRDELGDAISRALGAQGPLGADWSFGYVQAQPAGGGSSTPADYARFLRAVLGKQLKMGSLLGTHAVCTNPKTCPGVAVKTPIPAAETWHYSIAHWVEDDPKVGDGAFSSPGAFGFYPWIDAGKQYYGIVAREVRRGVMSGDPSDKPAVQSVACGRLIRAAWLDGQARP